MKRNYNPRKIKAKNSYTFSEIAEVYKVHTRTVQLWRKQGLKIIDENVKPYLVYGEDFREFMKEHRNKRKVKLCEDEFYCTKCHAARKSSTEKLRVVYTGKKLGKSYNMINIKGNCELCGTSVIKFSSDRILMELSKTGKIFIGHGIGLIDNDSCALNTDISDDKRFESFQYLQLIKKTI